MAKKINSTADETKAWAARQLGCSPEAIKVLVWDGLDIVVIGPDFKKHRFSLADMPQDAVQKDVEI